MSMKLFLSTAMLLVATGPVAASPAARSFASAFFISRNGDGRIEVLGTAVIWLLLCMSAAAVGLAIAMASNNRRNSMLPDGFVEQMQADITAKRFRDAMARADASDSFIGRIMAEAMRQAPHGWNAVIRTLEQASEERTVSRLRRPCARCPTGSALPDRPISGHGVLIVSARTIGKIRPSGWNTHPSCTRIASRPRRST